MFFPLQKFDRRRETQEKPTGVQEDWLLIRKGLSCFHLGLASPFLEKTRSSIQQLDIYITHNMGFKVLLVILKLSLHFDSQTSLMNGQDRFYYPCFIIEETEARELK